MAARRHRQKLDDETPLTIRTVANDWLMNPYRQQHCILCCFYPVYSFPRMVCQAPAVLSGFHGTAGSVSFRSFFPPHWTFVEAGQENWNGSPDRAIPDPDAKDLIQRLPASWFEYRECERRLACFISIRRRYVYAFCQENCSIASVE